jgi:glycosyl transferase family 25
MTMHAAELNRYFDKVYVLTIVRNQSRQAEVVRTLQEQGLKFDFFWGLDGRELDPNRCEAEGLYSASLNRVRIVDLLTPGELACALSHRAICAEVLRAGFERVLVLEDDIAIRRDQLPQLPGALKAMPADWELVYLGYCAMNLQMPLGVRLKCLSAYPLLNALGIRPYNVPAIRRIYRRAYTAWWDRAGSFNGAFAYGITAAAAQKILAYQTPVTVQSDRAFQRMIMEGRLAAYSLRHTAFEPRWDLASSIGPRPSWK